MPVLASTFRLLGILLHLAGDFSTLVGNGCEVIGEPSLPNLLVGVGAVSVAFWLWSFISGPAHSWQHLQIWFGH